MIGSIASVAGDLVGGLMSNHNARKDRAESRRQFNAQMDFQKNQTQYRVQDALKAGINPLSALGVSSNVSPTISTGGNDGGAGHFSNAIRGLSNIFNRQEKESRDLDLEAKRIRNNTMRAELDILRQPGTSGGNSSMEQPPIGTDTQLFRVVHDINGDPRLMVNQDVTENDADNAGYISSLQYAYRTGGIGLNGRVTSPQLQMMIDDAHYRATGRHISNLDRLYLSPSELAIAARGAWRN